VVGKDLLTRHKALSSKADNASSLNYQLRIARPLVSMFKERDSKYIKQMLIELQGGIYSVITADLIFFSQ
jgi:hypothetical protein